MHNKDYQNVRSQEYKVGSLSSVTATIFFEFTQKHDTKMVLCDV